MDKDIDETGRVRILTDFTGYPGGTTREHRRFFAAGEIYEGPQAALYVEKGLAIDGKNDEPIGDALRNGVSQNMSTGIGHVDNVSESGAILTSGGGDNG